MARDATGRPTATPRRSAGAGRVIGTPGSGSPRPVVDSPSTNDVQPYLPPWHHADATPHGRIAVPTFQRCGRHFGGRRRVHPAATDPRLDRNPWAPSLLLV